MKIRQLGVAASLLGLALACGAGPGLTPDHFEQIRQGMTTAEVKALLGEPTRVHDRSIPVIGTVTTYVYDDGKSHAELVFRRGHLRLKTGDVGR
jgi:hypothetical protein